MLLTFSLAVSVGAVFIPGATVRGVLANALFPGAVPADWPAGHAAIVWNLRLPRAILATLVGAGLAVTGAALQAVTRNPLADPHLLGISSAAAFGAILALLHTGLFLGLSTVPLLAFAGALVTTLLVLGVAQAARATSADRMVLAGAAVSFIVMALANLLIFLGDPRATLTVVFWMLGGLDLAQWAHPVWPLLALVPLGLNVARFRLAVFVAGALIAGVMVTFSGIIGFVGLMVPHVARMMVGGDHARVLPASAMLGAILLLWSDIASRTVMAPEDMPIGIVTGQVGALFFVWLLRGRHL